jgi:5'-3' exonuclease
MQHLIVDSHYLLHRVMNVPALAGMRRSDGMSTGGVYGFLKTLRSALMKLDGVVQCTAVFDLGYSARRKLFSEEYKSNRHKLNPTDADLEYKGAFRSNRQYLKYALSKLGCRVIELPSREADDIIYFLASTTEGSKVVLSDDKDMLQNVRKEVAVYRPMADVIVTTDNFLEETGYVREHYILARALVGDPGDCIFGINGIGPKGAANLVNSLPVDCDDPVRALLALESAPNVRKKAIDLVRVSEDLIRKNMFLLDLSLEEFEAEEIEKMLSILSLPAHVKSPELLEFFSKMEFKSLFSQERGGLDDTLRWLTPFHRLR